MKPELIEKLTKAISDSLKNISDSVAAKINSENDKNKDSDKDKDKNVIINIDSAELGKSIATILKNESKNDDDEDEGEQEDDYSEMNKKELLAECAKRKITVYSKNDETILIKKLRKWDEANPDGVVESKPNSDDVQKDFEAAISKAMKELGINPAETSVVIKSKKKGVIPEGKNKFESDDDTEYDLSTPDGVRMAYKSLDDSDKDNLINGYFIDRLKYKSENQSQLITADDEE